MTDYPRKHGSVDRDRINVHERYELEYWSNKFGVSRDRLKELVKRHGVMAKDIEKALGREADHRAWDKACRVGD